jgi:hypothetical protein
MRPARRLLVLSLATFATGFVLGGIAGSRGAARAAAKERIFELRTYTTEPGKLANLHARFRNDTMRIFENHGMTNVGYFVPLDAPASESTLVYLIAHADRGAAAKSWQAFRDDPEWQKVSRESQVDGRIVSKVESVFLEATDYSPLK